MHRCTPLWLVLAALAAAAASGRGDAATQPAATSTAPTLTPYVAFAWHGPITPLPHVVGTVWYNRSTDPAPVAGRLKRLPPGERSLLRWSGVELLDQRADLARGQHVPWIPAGAAAEAAFNDRYFADLAQDGATVDYLVLDTEWGIGTWNTTPPQLAAIEADPRWPGLCTTFGINPANLPIGSLYGTTPQFDTAMQVTMGGYLHAAFDAPLVKHFPAAHCSDYQDVLLSPALAPQAPDYNNCVQPTAPPLHGDTQAPSFYGDVGNIRNAGVIAARPLSVVIWETDSMRAYAQWGQEGQGIQGGQAAAPVIPWVAGPSYGNSVNTSAYHAELVDHLLLSGGCTNLNLFDPNVAATQTDCAALDAILSDVQTQSGNSATLKPLTAAPVPYGASVLASGALLQNGHKLYRVTVATTQPTPQSLSVILPGDATATPLSIPAGQVGTWFSR